MSRGTNTLPFPPRSPRDREDPSSGSDSRGPVEARRGPGPPLPQAPPEGPIRPESGPWILPRTLLTVGLVGLFLLLPGPEFKGGGPESNLPSIPIAVGVFVLVIMLGKTLYDTLFSRP